MHTHYVIVGCRCQRHPGTNPDAAAESKKVSGTGAAAAATADSVVRNNRGLAVNTNEYDDNDLEGLENAAAILGEFIFSSTENLSQNTH